MAVESGSQKLNYLVKFDSTTQKADLYFIKGFDPTPNSVGTEGAKHNDALIYAEDLTATGNFPVKGFIVGGTNVIWSYNDLCNEPDFGMTNNFS